MPNNGNQQPPRPPRVSILRQGYYLIASIHTALDDRQLTGFQRDLTEQIGRNRTHGVIIDLTEIDVLDSFAARTLRNLAQIGRLRGADTVIVGINPGVASAITQLGMHVDIGRTALDLEDGFAILDERARLDNRLINTAGRYRLVRLAGELGDRLVPNRGGITGRFTTHRGSPAASARHGTAVPHFAGELDGTTHKRHRW
jgi:rsbT antagonist protein RsbS